jgi:hypothetical protein
MGEQVCVYDNAHRLGPVPMSNDDEEVRVVSDCMVRRGVVVKNVNQVPCRGWTMEWTTASPRGTKNGLEMR